MAVKLLVCELVMAGRSTGLFSSLDELGAIQRVYNREQVTVRQNRIKRNLHQAQRGKKEGVSEQQADEFGFF